MSENKHTKNFHINFDNVDLSGDESFSMMKRYNFDPLYAETKLAEIQRDMDELRMKQELKEYEEMNYDAICKRMYKYSVPELLRQLCICIIAIMKE